MAGLGVLRWAAVLALCSLAAGCTTPTADTDTPAAPPPPTAASGPDLDQGWDEAMKEKFWFTDQGSQIIPYAWFLALEQSSSTELFRSDENLAGKYGYLPAAASELNPDALPVGLVKDVDRGDGEAWFGLTCSACHTLEIEHGGTVFRVEGGPALADFWTFYEDLVAALGQTVDDEARFERFAGNVLGENPEPAAVEALSARLVKINDEQQERYAVNKPPTPWGHARLDAFGAILNQVTTLNLGVPENAKSPDAPVSYPFLWDTPQHDVVQWNGSASNKNAGDLARNVGEVLGVFGRVDVDTDIPPLGYPSSVDIPNLGLLESWVKGLRSPLWPEEVLGTVDQDKAARGKELYDMHCVECHAHIDRADPERKIEAVMVGLADIGTDPTMATNVLTRVSKSGILEGQKVEVLKGDPLEPVTAGVFLLTNQTVGVMLHQLFGSVEAAIEGATKTAKEPEAPPKIDAYKARPLNGIWATAPFLHNGSVLNLYELLLPVDQRSATFRVGSRKYDPEHVGFESAGSFEFDTTLAGNSNAGHSGQDYGTELGDEDRWAVVEYLKTL